MKTAERLQIMEHWLEKAEYRLLQLEHRVQMENLALTALRWAASVAGAAAIVAIIQKAMT